MSVRVMNEVFRRSKATLGARLVLLAVADAAGDDGIAWPSIENLAEKALMADSSVRRVVKDVAELEEIQVWQVRMGRSTINVYRVLLGDLDEPNLRRMPKEIAALFTQKPLHGPPADIGRVNPDAHPPILEGSPADPEHEPGGGVHEGKEEPLGTENISAEPPAVVLVNGRNLPLDAIAEVTGITEGSPRMMQAVVALNGKKGQVDKGIRHLYWGELRRWADENGRHDRLRELLDDPEQFADYLAKTIRRRGQTFKEEMPGIVFGPGKLRDWFLDLDGLAEQRGTPTADDDFDWGDS